MTPIEPLSTEFVLEAQVNCAEALRVGPSAHGHRQLIPISGGSFNGPRLSGKVLPGGADWQLGRPDGVREIEARYTIQTEDGALIGVRNVGLAVTPAETPPYVRTAPSFDAPTGGPYEWLNKSLFVGTLGVASREPLVVLVRVFRVK
jgi:hypothetical protein